jgi:hypothetical protein
MKSGRIMIMICVLAAVLLLCVIQDAQAKVDTSSADQELGQKTGLGKKEIDASKLPGALEYTIVIGSVIAVIGVIKFV